MSTEFHSKADDLIDKVVEMVEENDWEIETILQEQVLTLEFADGTQIVVNKHQINKEIWLASKAGAQHFRLNQDKWIDSKTGQEFFHVLNNLIKTYEPKA